MHLLRTPLLLALAASTAGAQADGYERTEGSAGFDAYVLRVSNIEIGLPDGPKIRVVFENPFGISVDGVRITAEWTANGEPQSTDLWAAGARCSRTGLYCSGMSSIRETNRDRAYLVRTNEWPQGFFFSNLEYDTRYCFRLRADRVAVDIPGVLPASLPWSKWTCVRTPPAPPPGPRPVAPSQLNVVILPASDGRGVPGGPLPVRALIEWEVPGDFAALDIDGYQIERTWWGQTADWRLIDTVKTSSRMAERTIAFAPGEEPTDERRFLFRVCTQNSAGRACSAPRATSPLAPDPLALKSGRKVEFPSQPGTVESVTAEGGDTRVATPPICETAKRARARNSPAAPGLEAQCRKAGGQVAPSQPSTTTSTAPTTVKAQGRVRLPSPAAAATEATASATAGPTVSARQPENTIDVRVRYSKNLGYKGSTSAFGNIGQTSCSAFIVSAVFRESDTRQRNPIPISSDFRMESSGDYYVCNYRVAEIPIGQPVTVSVYVADQDKYARWEGGTSVQPPAGEWRTIVDGSRNAELNSIQPRARLSFEMVYAPVSQR